MESLIQGHFDEDPDRAMTRAGKDATAVDSTKKASDARELLGLKTKKEEDELQAKVKVTATPKPIQMLAQVAVDSPIDTDFGALGGGDEVTPDVPSVGCLYVRKLLALANHHEILKGASFDVPPDTNALCQRMANEVHRSVLPGESHATAMASIKDEHGLRTSAIAQPRPPIYSR